MNTNLPWTPVNLFNKTNESKDKFIESDSISVIKNEYLVYCRKEGSRYLDIRTKDFDK